MKDPELILTPRPWQEAPIPAVAELLRQQDSRVLVLYVDWPHHQLRYEIPAPILAQSHSVFRDQIQKDLYELINDGTNAGRRRLLGAAFPIGRAMTEWARSRKQSA